MSVPTRQLGKNGPQVTAIGFGLMGLSIFYGETPSDEERLAFLDNLYDTGERFWDSSDLYGDSEVLVGKWFAKNPEKRKNLVLATKFGVVFPDGKMSVCNSAEYVIEACETSLKRLNTDYIDLYYIHRVDVNTPIEVPVGAMKKLKEQGKIRYLGLSEVSAATLRRAYAVEPIAAAQMEYSPFSLDIEKPETDFLNTCKELGVALVAYSPLSRGLLSGRYKSHDEFDENDGRRNMPRFSAENFDKNIKLVKSLQSIAARKKCTPSQLALAWLLAQWDMVIPIPGTKTAKYYHENMGGLDVKLSETDLKEIRECVNNADVHGDRYYSGLSQTLFADTVPYKG